MELRIEKLTLPEVINFNFSELKQEITNVTANYANLVYDEGQMREAKKDVAALRKFTKALSDERIRVKKEILKPYDAFEAKVKELTGIVDSAIDNIDSQIKGAEEKRKKEKAQKIEEHWFEVLAADKVPEGVEYRRIFEDRWLNASVSLKTACDEMDARLEQIASELATLANLPEFGFECIEVYKNTLNLTTALNEGRRLSEMAKRAEEARRAAEEAKAAKAKQQEEQLPSQISFTDHKSFEECMNPPEAEEKPQMQWVAFRALLSAEDAAALRDFFQMRDIRFEPIKG